MKANGISAKILLRTDNNANWTTQSLKVVYAGELVVNQNEGNTQIKVGDGSTPFQALPGILDSISLDFIDEVCDATVQLA